VCFAVSSAIVARR